MILRKSLFAGFVMSTFLCASLVPAYSASASTLSDSSSSLTAEDLHVAQERMQAAGVDESVQGALIQKLADGELLDSTTGQHQVRTFEGAVDGSPALITEYADGSRRWETIAPATTTDESDAGTVHTTAGISDCEDVPGVGTFWHNNCRVSSNDAISTAGFIVDYATSDVSVLPAEVRDPRGASCSLAGGTCTVTAATVDRAKAEGTSPARASMSFTGTFVGNSGSIVGSVWIDVIGMSATAHKTPVS